MQVEVLTLRYDPTRGVMDETTLRTFVRDKVVLSVKDHFFTVGNAPHLALVIEYRLPAATLTEPAARRGRREGSARTDELRTRLGTAEREVFDLLRTWRARRAHEEAVPAYAVLSNAQLVAIASGRPDSRSALMRVEGLGRRKAERYGDEILGLLGRGGEAEPVAPDAGDAGETATGGEPR